jgi:hypothetical protein
MVEQGKLESEVLGRQFLIVRQIRNGNDSEGTEVVPKTMDPHIVNDRLL